MSAVPTIHRFPVEHEGAVVNAYLVETASGVVAVDGLLQVSAAKEMRAGIDRLGKPLLAAVLTHSHPDHYAGLGQIVAGDDVPIYAPQGVIDTITADDALKDQIVGPMFGEEWPADRVFPDTAIGDGESVTFDDVTLTVIDLGPSESPHDSPWILGDEAKTVFLGDQIYDHKHCYLADGFYVEWLREHREASRALPRRCRLPHRPWRSGRCRDVGLATRLHRALRRHRLERRLVRARAGEGDGCGTYEGVRALGRAPVSDGAERRACRRQARAARIADPRAVHAVLGRD